MNRTISARDCVAPGEITQTHFAFWSRIPARAICSDMRRAISSPEGKRAINRLRLLLKAVDCAFDDPTDFHFPWELKELRDAIEAVLPFLRRKNSHPFPFWKAIQAVNTELPRLYLEKRLTEMVDRATSGPIGPLRQLYAMAEDGSLSVDEQRLLPILEKQIVNCTPTQRQLNDFAPLVTKLPLPVYNKLRRPYANFSGIERDLLNGLAYCSFLMEHYRWKAKYFSPLCELYELLLALEDDRLMSKLKRVLMNDGWPSVAWEIEARQKSNARLRNWRRQNKKRRLQGKPEKPIPQVTIVDFPSRELHNVTIQSDQTLLTRKISSV